MSETNDTLSTATEQSSNTPVTIDGTVIQWDGNPGRLDGVLHELSQYYARTGAHAALLENGAIALSNGKLAVESVSVVPFKVHSGHTDRRPEPSLLNMAPDRIAPLRNT